MDLKFMFKTISEVYLYDELFIVFWDLDQVYERVERRFIKWLLQLYGVKECLVEEAKSFYGIIKNYVSGQRGK